MVKCFLRALADEGVEHVFGYPGGAVLHIYDALFQQERINHYLVRHGQAAGHMADAYSRVTGKTRSCSRNISPGTTNTVTPIATAYMDSIPMVILSGQVSSHLIGEDAFQETDIVGISSSNCENIASKCVMLAKSLQSSKKHFISLHLVIQVRSSRYSKDATNPAEKVRLQIS